MALELAVRSASSIQIQESTTFRKVKHDSGAWTSYRLSQAAQVARDLSPLLLFAKWLRE